MAVALRRLAQVASMLHAGLPRWHARPALLLVAAITMGAAWPAVAAGPRVVSLNLCTDQLLLVLADPDQIVGLSPYAVDRQRSAIAERARGFAVLSGTAEEVLVIRPDLVLAGRYTKRATRELLKAQGLRVVEFEAVTSIEEAEAQLRDVGALVGHPDRAEREVAAIEAALARVRDARAERPLTVLPLQRRGWVSGRRSLMTSLLDAVGLHNAGADLSPTVGQVTLEAIVRSRPDLLLLARSRAAEDQGTAFLQHPVLQDLYPPERRLTLPEQMTVCGGPEIGPALDRLAAEIRRLPVLPAR